MAGSIVAIDDITNDGNVELLLKVGFPLMEVWIHSWDGVFIKSKNIETK